MERQTSRPRTSSPAPPHSHAKVTLLLIRWTFTSQGPPIYLTYTKTKLNKEIIQESYSYVGLLLHRTHQYTYLYSIDSGCNSAVLLICVTFTSKNPAIYLHVIRSIGNTSVVLTRTSYAGRRSALLTMLVPPTRTT